jgi:CheY-like chemotaxis protein
MSGRVLFVSDDAGAHRAFRAAFAPAQRDWEVTAARGGAEALARLERAEYDALVAEAQLAGTDCADVLLAARRRERPSAAA